MAIFEHHRHAGREFLVVKPVVGAVKVIDSDGNFYGSWFSWEQFQDSCVDDPTFCQPISEARLSVTTVGSEPTVTEGSETGPPVPHP